MKILISGSLSEYSANWSFVKAFRRLGYETILIDDEREYWNNFPFTTSKLFRRISHRLFWKILSKKINDLLLIKVKEIKPDLILIIKGWFYSPKIIKKIKEVEPNSKLICFYWDNPFNTWHHSTSNNWVRESIPFYDFYFIPKRFLLKKLEEQGAKKVFYLPCGCDPEVHYPIEVKDLREKEYYGSDIAFIGTWDKEREWWLSHLVDYNLKIWGNDWNRANRKLQSKWMKKPAYGEEFAKICSASKIILNIIRKQDKTSHNMKTFEIPACKGFILSNYEEEAVEFFPENTVAVYYKNVDDLKTKINFYLINGSERSIMVDNAYKTLINGRHSYEDRIKNMLKLIER